MNTAIILAGGYSSRMGVNKAELEIGGKTLLEIQAEKAVSAGFNEIIVSGCRVPGMRCVPDVFPHKGPLSGIHAGLLAAASESCLVLCVDMPLLPAEVLKELAGAHRGGITLLAHGPWEEPTVGIYDRSLVPMCEEILRSENTSIRVLMRQAGYRKLVCDLEEEYLLNCNTPEDYRRICIVSEKTQREV